MEDVEVVTQAAKRRWGAALVGVLLAGGLWWWLRSEAEGGLVLFCEHEEKAALLESGDPAFYTTPHYDGYPTILVNLEHVDPEVLEEMIVESWRRKAPKRLLRQFDAEHEA